MLPSDVGKYIFFFLFFFSFFFSSYFSIDFHSFRLKTWLFPIFSVLFSTVITPLFSFSLRSFSLSLSLSLFSLFGNCFLCTGLAFFKIFSTSHCFRLLRFSNSPSCRIFNEVTSRRRRRHVVND